MATAFQVEHARAIACYLVRALWRRVDWQSMPASRRRELTTELTDSLFPLAISERSVLGWCRALCDRFAINPSGGGFVDRDGAERSAQSVHVLLPRRWVPDGTPENPARSTDTHTSIRWDIACRLIRFDALRIALHESPLMVTTFVTSEPIDGEDDFFVVPSDDPNATSWRPTLPEQLITPRAFSTVWTGMSAIHHGADSKTGNTSLFRRQRMVSPITGEQYLVPFISGNAVRGRWRDMFMYRLFRLLELRDRDLPPHRAHALLAGGSVDKGADTGKVDTAIRNAARDNCPPWELVGGVIEQQIMKGLLRVHDAILVCRENAWMLHQRLQPHVDGDPLSLEEWTPSLKQADDLLQLRLHTRHKHADLDESDGIQMLVNVEGTLPGVQWAHSFMFLQENTVSDLAKSCMADLLEEFRGDASMAAKTAAAHGQIAFDPYLPGEGTPELTSPDIYRQWVIDNAEAVREWLLCNAVKEPKQRRGRGRQAEAALA